MSEVPEADAAEQAQTVEAVEPALPVTLRDDVPEADALEQSLTVPYDEDDARS